MTLNEAFAKLNAGPSREGDFKVKMIAIGEGKKRRFHFEFLDGEWKVWTHRDENGCNVYMSQENS